MLNLEKWILAFIERYRFEGLLLGPKERQYFAPYVKEQLLLPPCEVEVVILQGPFCLMFLFIFGPHVRDRRISIHNTGWNRLDSLLEKLGTKYAASRAPISHEKLKTVLIRISRNAREKDSESRRRTMYGIDFIQNACAIYFYQDIRLETWPWSGKGATDPSSVADYIFHLNYNQAVDEKMSGPILDAVVKELEKY